jgi:hypothetical protein
LKEFANSAARFYIKTTSAPSLNGGRFSVTHSCLHKILYHKLLFYRAANFLQGIGPVPSPISILHIFFYRIPSPHISKNTPFIFLFSRFCIFPPRYLLTKIERESAFAEQQETDELLPKKKWQNPLDSIFIFIISVSCSS